MAVKVDIETLYAIERALLRYKGIKLVRFRETTIGTTVTFRGPTIARDTHYSEVSVPDGWWPMRELWFWEGTLKDIYYGMLDHFKESIE